jgi:hypothetical protein
MKYDWCLDETDSQPKFISFELANMTNPAIRLKLRKRKCEINVDIGDDEVTASAV